MCILKILYLKNVWDTIVLQYRGPDDSLLRLNGSFDSELSTSFYLLGSTCLHMLL